MKASHITLLAAMLGTASIALAQSTVRLGADTIDLGDQTTLTIANATQYPSADILQQGDIVVISQNFDTATHTQTSTITCFEPGLHYIHYAPADSIAIVVNDVVIDSADADLHDIAPIQRVPHTFWEVFRWVLLAIGIALLSLGVRWLVKHFAKVQQIMGVAEPTDDRTPYQRATDNVEQLRLKRLWQAGKVKEYYTDLTDIVRRFIEESTGIRATDMTSDETLAAMSHHGGVETLRSIFATADMVKFAKSQPLPQEHDRALVEAVAYIDQLWQAVKPNEQEEQPK